MMAFIVTSYNLESEILLSDPSRIHKKAFLIHKIFALVFLGLLIVLTAGKADTNPTFKK